MFIRNIIIAVIDHGWMNGTDILLGTTVVDYTEFSTSFDHKLSCNTYPIGSLFFDEINAYQIKDIHFDTLFDQLGTHPLLVTV